MKVMSKECTKCDGAEKLGKEPEEHAHPKNVQGSSKSMEVQAIYKVTVDVWDNCGFAIGTIVSDDDTTMKSHLKHCYQELIKAGQIKKEEWPKTKSGNKTSDTGRLPLHVKVSPKFLADPNHCKKVVGKYLYVLAVQPKKQAKLIKLFHFIFVTILMPCSKKIIHLDFKKDINLIQNQAKAPLEHVFDNHDYCDIAWCYKKKALEEGLEYSLPPNRPFYNKVSDAQLYDTLFRFIQDNVLKESDHDWDTQLNESLNQAIARLCPKFNDLVQPCP
mmetsp:Transcript_22377/g.32687  ORF Transcript_22377/g.32687 Transcript_22377/m.32687 type:complete len:274 (+) Transcript_22377:1478-2299(+)